MASKEEIIAKTNAAREARKLAREREAAAIHVQKCVRGWLVRLRIGKEIRQNLDKLLAQEQPISVELYKSVRRYQMVCRPQICHESEFDRLDKLARVLIMSLDHEDPKKSYVGVALNKDHALSWISHMKSLLATFCHNISLINPESSNGQKHLSSWLGALTAFTKTTAWKVFQKPEYSALAKGMEKLTQTFLTHLTTSASMMQIMKGILLKGLAKGYESHLKKTVLIAIMTLVTRPMPTEKHLSALIIHILSVPGLIHHCGPELTQNLIIKNGLMKNAIGLLAQEQQLKIHFNSLEGSYALCLTANMIDVSSMIEDFEENQVNFIELVSVFKRLLDLCGQYVTAKKSNLTHWHPVLGWFSVSMDSYLQNSIPLVRSQLAKLWSPGCLKYFTKPLISTVARLPAPPPPPVPQISSPDAQYDQVSGAQGATGSNQAKQFFIKAFEKTMKLKDNHYEHTSQVIKQVPASIKLGHPDCYSISLVCSMYASALKTLTQIRLEILAGLCYGDLLLPNLWVLLQSLGPFCGQKHFLDLLATNPKATSPEFQMMILFADCTTHLLTILDDVEMYEKQKSFALGHFVTLSTVVNQFLFKAIWSNLILDTASPLFVSLHSLLSVLYRRDNRRPFTKPNHWLIKDIKPKELISEMDKGRRAAALLIQKMPHIIPHADRYTCFDDNSSWTDF